MKNKIKIFLPLLTLVLFMGSVSVAKAEKVTYEGKKCTVTGSWGPGHDYEYHGTTITIDLGFGKKTQGCLYNKIHVSYLTTGTNGVAYDGIDKYFASVYPISSTTTSVSQ